MKSFRAIVVGTGFIGPVHVEGLRRAGIDVVGIIGSTPEKTRAACRQSGLPIRDITFQGALHAPDVDVVHLATPNVLHYDQVKSVLAAGKHCLCEKPLAMNSRQSAELVRLAADSGLVTGVAYNVRFYPLCHEAAARVASGAVGGLISVVGSYVQDWLLYPHDYNWRVVAEEGGALRAVSDIGTHWFDLIQFVTGKKIAAVCADLRTVHQQRFRAAGNAETFSGLQPRHTGSHAVDVTSEDCGAVLVRFENGVNGCLWVSQVTAGRKNMLRFELSGTEASLAWESESPEQLWVGHRGRPNELLTRDPALLDSSAAAISSYPGGHNEGFPDTFKQLFCAFYAYLQRGDLSAPAPFPTFADGHHEIVLCDAIARSNRERRWVDVSEFAL